MDYNYLKYKKILIVDDEVGLLEMVTSILEQDGFKEIKLPEQYLKRYLYVRNGIRRLPSWMSCCLTGTGFLCLSR